MKLKGVELLNATTSLADQDGDARVFVAMSVFGLDDVIKAGQVSLLKAVAEAGAAGAEIRRELLSDPASELPAIRRQAHLLSLALAYSAPFAFFDVDGKLDAAGFQSILLEAQGLGAEILKITIGHAPKAIDADSIGRLVCDAPMRITVENDQTDYAGSLSPFLRFLQEMRKAGLPVSATFDIGNWAWVEEDPVAAARLLGSFVSYVHVKQGLQTEQGWEVCGFPKNDRTARAVFSEFARNLPRAIEYPVSAEQGTALRNEIELVAAL